MVEAATIGASTTHGYMQTRDNMQQGVDGGGCKPNLPFILGCLTGVTDSSNRDDEEKKHVNIRKAEKTEIHTQTCPEQHLPCVSELRSTSAASQICTKGSTM